MIIKDKTIDGGKGFDWGRVSSEYAKYRDIYPKIFFQKILDLGFMQRWSEDIGFRNRNRCFTKKYVLLWWDLDRNRYFGRTN